MFVILLINKMSILDDQFAEKQVLKCHLCLTLRSVMKESNAGFQIDHSPPGVPGYIAG